ncbi:MAG: Protein phosphatase 2C 2 [Peltula sp. TS41687]|nr:MAG: Protein phosphatase 2C 2 [Peltula sp. TS41687]
MGQTLSEPVTEKNSDKGEDAQIIFGVSAMQGWRISMEDAHATILDLRPEEENGKVKALSGEANSKLSFFGVYDGHGGERVALFSGENVHKIIAKQEAFAQGNLEQALKDGFLATDRALLNHPKYAEEVSGCTASVGLISKDKIYVANAGDSRTVLGVKGRAKPLSFDHKPQNEGERARITAAGGFVDFGRVNGNLALSRAIGDFEFKKSTGLPPEQQIVTAYPEVVIHEVTDDDEFLVIACDGIWDCQSSQAVVEFVRRGIAAGQELYRICENMMDNCLASNSETGGVGCDNMTMIIVGLLRGKTKEDWYREVARRVANGDGPSEFRGPGVHHSPEASGDDIDTDNDKREARNRIGRIIMLGNSPEENNEPSEVHFFDYSKEDKDLESQVDKGQARVTDVSDTEGKEEEEDKVTNEKRREPDSPFFNTGKTNHTESTAAETVDEVKNDEDDQPGTPTKRRTLEHLGSSSVPEKLFTPSKSETGDKEDTVVATPSSQTPTRVAGTEAQGDTEANQ